MTPDNKQDAVNLAKGAGAWAAVKSSNWIAEQLASIGIHNWGEASQAAAWFLSVCLIADFFWKRFFRKYAERRWPKRFPRRRKRRTDFVDSTDSAPLGDR